MIRTLDEAEAAVREVLAEPDPRARLLRLPVLIAQCGTAEARAFLEAAGERLKARGGTIIRRKGETRGATPTRAPLAPSEPPAEPPPAAAPRRSPFAPSDPPPEPAPLPPLVRRGPAAPPPAPSDDSPDTRPAVPALRPFAERTPKAVEGPVFQTSDAHLIARELAEAEDPKPETKLRAFTTRPAERTDVVALLAETDIVGRDGDSKARRKPGAAPPAGTPPPNTPAPAAGPPWKGPAATGKPAAAPARPKPGGKDPFAAAIAEWKTETQSAPAPAAKAAPVPAPRPPAPAPKAAGPARPPAAPPSRPPAPARPPSPPPPPAEPKAGTAMLREAVAEIEAALDSTDPGTAPPAPAAPLPRRPSTRPVAAPAPAPRVEPPPRAPRMEGMLPGPTPPPARPPATAARAPAPPAPVAPRPPRPAAAPVHDTRRYEPTPPPKPPPRPPPAPPSAPARPPGRKTEPIATPPRAPGRGGSPPQPPVRPQPPADEVPHFLSETMADEGEVVPELGDAQVVQSGMFASLEEMMAGTGGTVAEVEPPTADAADIAEAPEFDDGPALVEPLPRPEPVVEDETDAAPVPPAAPAAKGGTPPPPRVDPEEMFDTIESALRGDLLSVEQAREGLTDDEAADLFQAFLRATAAAAPPRPAAIGGDTVVLDTPEPGEGTAAPGLDPVALYRVVRRMFDETHQDLPRWLIARTVLGDPGGVLALVVDALMHRREKAFTKYKETVADLFRRILAVRLKWGRAAEELSRWLREVAGRPGGAGGDLTGERLEAAVESILVSDRRMAEVRTYMSRGGEGERAALSLLQAVSPDRGAD